MSGGDLTRLPQPIVHVALLLLLFFRRWLQRRRRQKELQWFHWRGRYCQIPWQLSGSQCVAQVHLLLAMTCMSMTPKSNPRYVKEILYDMFSYLFFQVYFFWHMRCKPSKVIHLVWPYQLKPSYANFLKYMGANFLISTTFVPNLITICAVILQFKRYIKLKKEY